MNNGTFLVATIYNTQFLIIYQYLNPGDKVFTKIKFF